MNPGDRIEMLTLLARTDERWRNNVIALWRCDCGNEKKIPIVRVKTGHAKSCGCLREKHGGATRRGYTPEYRAWQAMWVRVRAKSGRMFHDYGARGISVCDRWREFSAFLSDMGPKPSRRHSLGRINNDLGYGPENCRWETPGQQQRNTRKSMVWSIKGLTFDSLQLAASHFGVDGHTIRYWVSKRDDCSSKPRY